MPDQTDEELAAAKDAFDRHIEFHGANGRIRRYVYLLERKVEALTAQADAPDAAGWSLAGDFRVFHDGRYAFDIADRTDLDRGAVQQMIDSLNSRPAPLSAELEAAKASYDNWHRGYGSGIAPTYVSLLERALEATRPEPADGGGFPKLGGRCPFCGATMFLAVGGWPTCSFVECPNPTCVADLLTDRRLRILNGDTQAAERKSAEMAEARITTLVRHQEAVVARAETAEASLAAESRRADAEKARADAAEERALAGESAAGVHERRGDRLRDLADSWRDEAMSRPTIAAHAELDAECVRLRATIEELRERAKVEPDTDPDDCMACAATEKGVCWFHVGVDHGVDVGLTMAKDALTAAIEDPESLWSFVRSHSPEVLAQQRVMADLIARVPVPPRTEMVAAKDVRPGMVLHEVEAGPVWEVTRRPGQSGDVMGAKDRHGKLLMSFVPLDRPIEVVVPSDGGA